MEEDMPRREPFSDIPDIKTPYASVLLPEAIQKHPEVKDALIAAFSEFDRQAIDNFTINDYDGVKFSSTKISITPDVVRRIATTNPKALAMYETPTVPSPSIKKSFAQREAVFCFTGYQEANSSLAAEDEAIDAFMRRLPLVARAMKEGEEVPQVNIYILGQPTEYGGEITQEWMDKLKQDGMDAYGNLYKRFIEKEVPENKRGDTNLLLQGVSMGTVTADRTYQLLPDEIKARTQRLFDNPAGTHDTKTLNSLRGKLRIGPPFLLEAGLRRYLDATGRAHNKAMEKFREFLANEKKISQGDPAYKKDAVSITQDLLLSGVPLDLDTRTYIRKGYKDFLTEGPAQFAKTILRNKKTDYQTKRRSLRALTDKSHIFIYENFDRWAQNLKYTCSPKPSSRE